MSNSPLSRELALRIGLAAQTLPDTSPSELITLLRKAIGLPLTEQNFGKLGLKTFRKAGGEPFLSIPAENLKAALQILKGEGLPEDEALPDIISYIEGDMPGSIKVACASNHGEELDGHFGSCNRFLIYQVSPDEIRLIDARSTTQPESDEDEKNKWRATLIKDCQVLHTVSIGGPAAAKVVRANVYPIKHPQGGEARDVLTELQKVLAGSPPPWLARVMGQEAATLAPFLKGAQQGVEQ